MTSPMTAARQASRYLSPQSPKVAEGWTLKRVTPPSRLFGANGLRSGPDGRIYIAQVTGSQISALDIDSGAIEAISAKGGDIVAPDDVAFLGNALIATEVMNGRVSVLENGLGSGRARVLRDDVPSANGITVHNGRLFIGECRPGGRILELGLDGAAPRVILENVPSPNAMEFGPDGKLYFPVMDANQIWRIDADAADATPEVVATDLGVPDSVKFDADGTIISTQVFSGQVLRVDPRTGAQAVLAQLNPGLDNCTLVDGRLFVSSFTGEITEVLGDGNTTAALPGGLNWPLDLAVGGDGALHIADGTFFYRVRSDPAGHNPAKEVVGTLFTPGYPGFIRGLVASGPGEFVVTTANGTVARYRTQSSEHDVLADGFDQLYGIDLTADGTPVVVEQGTGRLLAIRSGAAEVLASGLNTPVGVLVDPDGALLVSEAGRVATIRNGRAETMVGDLVSPQGLVIRDGKLYIVDSGAKSVIEYDLSTGARQTISTDLPLGAPAGVTPKPLLGMPPFSGPQGPFAGITTGSCDPTGTLYLSADADGSVLALVPTHP